jgi:hypothetical protein
MEAMFPAPKAWAGAAKAKTTTKVSKRKSEFVLDADMLVMFRAVQTEKWFLFWSER